jgi:hypothetical protein
MTIEVSPVLPRDFTEMSDFVQLRLVRYTPGQIGRVILVATNTPKTVAVLRMLPEIVMIASDTGGC